MPFTRTVDCPLHYLQIPSDRGPEAEHVIMIHGLATSMAFWYFQLAPQLATAFNVTLYDLRGHGRSRTAMRGYSPFAMANDLRELMDSLAIERAHIISHSFGGLIGLHFARRQPDRVLTLTIADTHLSLVRHIPKRWEHGEKIQKILRQRGLELDVSDPYFGFRLLTEAAKMQVAEENSQLEVLREWIHPFIGRSGKRGAKQWLKLLESTSAEKEIMSDDGVSDSMLTTLDTPTLAVYGENSQALGSGKKLSHLLSNAELEVIPRAGHFFPASRPKALLGAWSRFQQRSSR